MDTFERDMRNGFARLDNRFETLGYVSRERYEADMRALNADVADLKNSARWVSRSMAGLVATFLVGLVMMVIETRGGL